MVGKELAKTPLASKGIWDLWTIDLDIKHLVQGQTSAEIICRVPFWITEIPLRVLSHHGSLPADLQQTYETGCPHSLYIVEQLWSPTKTLICRSSSPILLLMFCPASWEVLLLIAPTWEWSLAWRGLNGIFQRGNYNGLHSFLHWQILHKRLHHMRSVTHQQNDKALWRLRYQSQLVSNFTPKRSWIAWETLKATFPSVQPLLHLSFHPN